MPLPRFFCLSGCAVCLFLCCTLFCLPCCATMFCLCCFIFFVVDFLDHFMRLFFLHILFCLNQFKFDVFDGVLRCYLYFALCLFDIDTQNWAAPLFLTAFPLYDPIWPRQSSRPTSCFVFALTYTKKYVQHDHFCFFSGCFSLSPCPCSLIHPKEPICALTHPSKPICDIPSKPWCPGKFPRP